MKVTIRGTKKEKRPKWSDIVGCVVQKANSHPAFVSPCGYAYGTDSVRVALLFIYDGVYVGGGSTNYAFRYDDPVPESYTIYRNVEVVIS